MKHISVHIRKIHKGFVIISKRTNKPFANENFKSRDNAIYFCGQNNLKITKISKFARYCDDCGSGMNEGFCIKGGKAYYCTEECMHKHVSVARFNKLYDNDDGDTYYSSWHVEDDGMADNQ